VVTLNLSKNLKSRRLVASSRIATLPNGDPSCNVQKPSFASVNDDVEDGDLYKEGRDDIMIMTSINAVDTHHISWSPATDVQVEPVDVLQDDDPDAIQAQVDSGAHVSCTDQKHMLNGYREFT